MQQKQPQPPQQIEPQIQLAQTRKKKILVSKERDILEKDYEELKNLFGNKKKQVEKHDDDYDQGTLFTRFQRNFLKQLKEKNHPETFIEDLGDSVRIIDISVQPWTLEEWLHIINNIEKTDVDRSKISLSLKHFSFPEMIRPRIWFWVTNIKKYNHLNPYKMYDKCRSQPNINDQQIKDDVERTLPDVKYFRGFKKKKEKPTVNELDYEDILAPGQLQLFYVLRAFANYNSDKPGSGYVQGMNYIAAVIIYYLDPNQYKNIELAFGDPEFCCLDQEVKAFLLLIHIFNDMRYIEIYQRKMKKMKAMISFLEKKLHDIVPEVLEKIYSTGQYFHIFFDSYFFTMFSYRSPIEFSVRIIDIFLQEGERIIFEVLLRMVYFSRKYILTLEENEYVLSFFKQDMVKYALHLYNIRAMIPLDHLEIINEY